MKVKYLTVLTITSLIGLSFVALPFNNYLVAQADPCAASADPCAASADPCAASAASSSEIPAIYTDAKAADNLAIRGYDPVAYFTEGKPVEGSSAYTYEWMGAMWQFSSDENKQLFVSNPEAFAPQYGGYCAFGLANGSLVSSVPDAWEIVDGKLYLNYDADVQAQWLSDTSGYIAAADTQWPQILASAKNVWYDTVGAVEY